MFGELSATIVLGRLRAPGPAGLRHGGAGLAAERQVR